MWQVMLLLMLLVSATTAVTSNVATASIFVPVVGGLATSMRVHPFTFMVPVGLTCSLAFVLPVSTPPNAIVFGTGRVTVGEMVRYGAFLDVLGVALIPPMVYALAG